MRRNWFRHTVLAAVLGSLPPSSLAPPIVLDDFERVASWQAAPADGVKLELGSDVGRSGKALRIAFDFEGRGGWAAVRRPLPLELPKNWELAFWIRGSAPSNTLEVKLTDRSGENVWWSVHREFAFPEKWQRVRVRRRQLSFAWGPAGGGELRQTGFFELAVTAGSGGAGTVWLDDLTLTELPTVEGPPPVPRATASSSLAGRGPELALSGEHGGWQSDPSSPGDQWLAVDLGIPRELGGLVIDWQPGGTPEWFAVSTSDDGAVWEQKWRVPRTQGGHSRVFLGGAEARWLRVTGKARPKEGVGIAHLTLEPFELTGTAEGFLRAAAADSRRGVYPRDLLGEQAAWTVSGAQVGSRLHGLLGADGAFDPAPRSFAVEPFVRLEGALLTWADVEVEQSLLDDALPIPVVTWTHPSLVLEITAFDSGDDASYILRYRVTNRTGRRLTPTLFAAVRPLQVNPSSQTLNTAGGVAPNQHVACEGASIVVDRAWGVVPRPRAHRCGATDFDAGDVVALLARGAFPGAPSGGGPFGSAALAWELDLAPGAATEVALMVPATHAERWTPPWGGLAADASREAVAAFVAGRLAASRERWQDRLAKVELSGPPEAAPLFAAVKTNLGFMLASRDGAALQPGTRAYARSWIRDGAMMAAALLRLGQADAVRDYILWFAPHIYPSGKVPCVVDRRGADPVPEHDSQGQWVFMVAEYLRHSGDRVTAEAVWPRIAAAVHYLDELRRERRTDDYRTPDRLAFFGTLPASISHEGYSAKPMHSYWDSFWALRGMKDAVWLASELGHHQEATRWAAIRDELAGDLGASVARTMAEHRIPYLPGCVELGDFDPTSSTVIPTIAGASDLVPPGAEEATWERYWREVERRFAGEQDWEVYTPYEWRNVGAMLRLGWRERAAKLASWLLADCRPAGWRQWPEVIARDPVKARFIGDMPHAWVGSDFIRSALDMLAFEDERRDALVLGAGVPARRLEDGGVSVRGLGTRWGPLSFSMVRTAETVRVQIGALPRVPRGGLVLRLPLAVRHATVNGVPARVEGGDVIVRALPADVEVRE
ncbi:MAG TPA: discoidin domain-containing protein [Thermoanaerobaculaceae bacterium]|nr:discoidin domain-containing protein [Thermoanaerobaculaceae bacterium]HRS15215.1 discoidin domain-containing protein [Thermoanaerobaculaceae bacterium]